MARDLSRLLNPRTIALFGGGWAANVIAQLKKSGYSGDIWPVHPSRETLGGIVCFKSLADLPSAPDANFIGINREATVDLVGELSASGAGGATCFASGFRESEGEGSGGAELQDRLVEAAGEMPILGPNCYGFLNYFDTVPFWPDEHGGRQVSSGVGIITQSSNIAINMTMQRRDVPIGLLLAAGNQAQTGIADLGETMLADKRVTAIGFYLEGFGDIRRLEAFMAKARKAGKPVVVLKTGKTETSRKSAITHTASMSGSADFTSALFRRLGMVEVDDVETFLETLKLLHHGGPLGGNAVASVSCSGGEAGLIADMAVDTSIDFRDLGAQQGQKIRSLLGPIVSIANPLDYHTFIWGDTARMTDLFSAVMEDGFDLSVFILDVPREDICSTGSFQCAVDAIIAARNRTGACVTVMSLLPENLAEDLAVRFAENGVIPLNGMRAGIEAIDAAIRAGRLMRASDKTLPLSFRAQDLKPVTLDEAASKALLSVNGIPVPNSVSGTQAGELEQKAVEHLAFPVALKVTGIAHKSEAGGVILNLRDMASLRAAFGDLPEGAGYLVEEMADGGLCELIIGVSNEQGGLQMLTIGAGGIYTELLRDKVDLLLPVSETEVKSALRRLRIWPMLDGYRGKPKAGIDALVETIMAVARIAGDRDGPLELDINPLIVRQHDVIAVDALIVKPIERKC